MPRWKELPDSLDPRVRHLVVHLRRLKDHTELSLAALAAKTPYSRSSWERYLNGAALPPQQAVEELARLGDGDLTRLRALHEVAASAWTSQSAAESSVQDRNGAETGESSHPPDEPADARGQDGGDTPEDERAETGATAATEERAPGHAADGRPTPAGGPSGDAPPGRAGGPARPRWRVRHALLAGAAVVVVAGVAGGVLAASPWSGDAAEQDPFITAHEGAFPEHPDGSAFSCDIQRGSGRTYAGHSTTRSAILELHSTSWHVVEVQCLLRDAGFSPGTVDGIYGAQTVAAVKRAQKHGGIPADGMVGPETWGVLRR